MTFIKKKEWVMIDMTKIVFDSSTLISIGNSCLYGSLVKIKERHPDLELIMPKAVYDEVIAIGDKVQKFAWNATRIQRLIDHKIMSIVNISKHEKYMEIEENVNGMFKSAHGDIEILQKGEIECLVLCRELEADALAIDELTTRLLIEKPSALEHFMETRYKTNVYVDPFKLKKYTNLVKEIKVVRSVDLIAYCYELGLFEEYNNKGILKAVLYSLKYGGCASTFEEIDVYCIEKHEFK